MFPSQLRSLHGHKLRLCQHSTKTAKNFLLQANYIIKSSLTQYMAHFITTNKITKKQIFELSKKVDKTVVDRYKVATEIRSLQLRNVGQNIKNTYLLFLFALYFLGILQCILGWTNFHLGINTAYKRSASAGDVETFDRYSLTKNGTMILFAQKFSTRYGF